jgi:hypothetical protein
MQPAMGPPPLETTATSRFLTWRSAASPLNCRHEQEGLRFTTNVVDCPPEDVHVGMPVRVQFEQHGEVLVPVFVPDHPGVKPPS